MTHHTRHLNQDDGIASSPRTGILILASATLVTFADTNHLLRCRDAEQRGQPPRREQRESPTAALRCSADDYVAGDTVDARADEFLICPGCHS